ncbi:MAG TPA: ABC transporter permease [Candidatus Binatia bacterium]|nr:ABC transporter permease [Candidatus Binatia bacterium]
MSVQADIVVDRSREHRGRSDPGAVTAAIRRSQRADRIRAFALAAPLLIFLLASFAVPIVILLSKAIYDPTIKDALPRTSAMIGAWPGGAPTDAMLDAVGADLIQAKTNDRLYELAKSLNSRLAGARSQILKTARRLDDPSLAQDTPAASAARIAAVKAVPFWSDPETWGAIRTGARGFTTFNLLNALDLRWTPAGSLGWVPADQAVFLRVFGRTFLIAGLVTLGTLLLGFPLAYLIANLQQRYASLVIVLVLLPFWTSILVRTAAWTVLLQKYGLLNEMLIGLGITGDRLELMYSRIGLIIAMTHIQLPFTLLPIYSVMRGIQPSQLRAAHSLGARPVTAFVRVYLPQVVPGIMAGCLLTFILCLGYYITPALIGGASDQLISNFIANYVNVDLNWEMAAALSFILLVMTIALYAGFARLLGLDRLKLL